MTKRMRRELIGYASAYVWLMAYWALMDAMHVSFWFIFISGMVVGTAWFAIVDHYWEWKDRPK
jgi:hypothetical protein